MVLEDRLWSKKRETAAESGPGGNRDHALRPTMTRSNPTSESKGVERTGRPWRDPDLLRELYHNQGMSLREIADELGCVNSTVYKNMQKYDIEARDRRIPHANLYTDRRGYERWQTWDVDRYRKVSVHQILAISEGASPDEVFGSGRATHHKNRIPWDNRPENVESMSQSEHVRRHAEGME